MGQLGLKRKRQGGHLEGTGQKEQMNFTPHRKKNDFPQEAKGEAGELQVQWKQKP